MKQFQPIKEELELFTKEELLWIKLYAIYHNLPSSSTKRTIERQFLSLRRQQITAPAALEAALISNYIFAPECASKTHEMDGAKEYDDILTDQAVFEALRED